jgi:exopolysaccharide production protein ExoQ
MSPRQNLRALPASLRGAALERNPSGFETGLAAVVFLFASGLFAPELAPDIGAFKINDFFVAMGAGVGWSILLTKMRGGFRWLDHRILLPLIAFYFFVGITIMWSGQPGAASARYLGFILVTGWTIYLALRFEFRVLLRLIVGVFIGIGIVSALLAVLVPSIGQMQEYLHLGDWRGIYNQKNSLGRQMTLLILMSIFMLFQYREKGLAWLGLIVGLAILPMTGSRTSFVITGIGVLSIIFLLLRRRPMAILGIIIAICFFVLSFALQAVVERDPLLIITGETVEIFGIPLEFTGRLGLWEFASGFVDSRPLFGYGYGGFWEDPRFGGQLVKEEGWLANDSHNGFYDLVLQTGFVGLAAFLAIYASHLYIAGRAVRQKYAPPAVQFASFYILFFLFANLTESYLLKATNVIQLLFSLAVMQLAIRPSIVWRGPHREIIEILPSGKIAAKDGETEIPTDEIIGRPVHRPFFRPRERNAQ